MCFFSVFLEKVARIFGCAPLTGYDNPKDDLLTRLSTCSVCHLATEVLWSDPALLFPYNDDVIRMMTSLDLSGDPVDEDVRSQTSSTSSEVCVTLKVKYINWFGSVRDYVLGYLNVSFLVNFKRILLQYSQEISDRIFTYCSSSISVLYASVLKSPML